MSNIETICPYCGIKNDRTTHTSLDTLVLPSKDDVTMCVECGEIAQFNADLSLRKADDDIFDHLELADLQKASFIIKAMRRAREKMDPLNEALSLEKHLIHPAEWDSLYHEMPPECQKVVDEKETQEPRGIGWEPKHGWFVLTTQGQGPMLDYSQRNPAE